MYIFTSYCMLLTKMCWTNAETYFRKIFCESMDTEMSKRRLWREDKCCWWLSLGANLSSPRIPSSAPGHPFASWRQWWPGSCREGGGPPASACSDWSGISANEKKRWSQRSRCKDRRTCRQGRGMFCSTGSAWSPSWRHPTDKLGTILDSRETN